MILVGDSLGNVVQGHDTTLPVTLDEVVYHTRLVARGCRHALVVGDMPFGSYQVSPEDAVRSAIRLVKEGGAQAVKLEGGLGVAEAIARIARAEIPVMGHVGLTPQSIHRMGGFRVQGRTARRARARDRRRRGRAGRRAPSPSCSRACRSISAAEITAQARDPDDRHRRRPALRRPGAGDARHARPERLRRRAS